MATSSAPDLAGTAVAVVPAPSQSLQPYRADPLLDAVNSLEQIGQLAAMMLQSGFMPRAINTEAKAVAVMLTGREMGLGPMQSIRGVNIIDGKLVVAADLQLALFKKIGGRATFTQLDDHGAIIMLRHPNGDEHTESFTMKDAAAAGLAPKENWKKHPRAMMRSRVITAALKSIGFEATTGVYDPEELEHLQPDGEDRQLGNGTGHSASAGSVAAAATSVPSADRASTASSTVTGVMSGPATDATQRTTASATQTSKASSPSSSTSTVDSAPVHRIDGGGEVSRYASRMASSNPALKGLPFDAVDANGGFLLDDKTLDDAGAFSAEKVSTTKDAATLKRWKQIGTDLAAELDRRASAGDATSSDGAAASSPSTGA